MITIKKNTLIYAVIAIVILMLGALLFSSNFKKSHLDSNKVIENLKNTEGYTADIKINIKNAKQDLTYSGNQKYIRKKGGQINLGEDRTFTYDKENINVKDNANNKEYNLPDNFDQVIKELFVGEFVNLMETSNQVVIENKELNNMQYLTISLLLPGYNKNLYKGIMYIDEQSGLPKEYHILDDKEKVRIICTYDKFLQVKEIENFEIS